MTRIAVALGIAALVAVPLVAQESETKTKTKVEVHGGEKVTASGCVRESADGLILTDVAGDVSHSYLLIGKSEELAKHVGHRVEITGKAADRKDGKVKTEVTSKTDGQKEQKTEVKSQGDLSVPVLGVQSIKSVRGSCS
jgi:hypothetical protein